MKAQENELAAIRQAVLQHLGIEPTVSRVFEGQARSTQSGGTLLRLPPTSAPPLQDAGTGALFFMVGQSAVGDDDPIAG